MAKEFSYRVGVDPDKGIQGLRELGRAAKEHLGDVNNTLEKGEDDAKAFAQAMRDAADKVEQRLKDTARASDALGKALGPDLANRLGQNGLDKMVTDMNTAGLTFDQITKDADELADGIKRLEQAGQGIGARVAPEFDKVEAASGKANKEMDKSTSVVANFAGNAAQDLPGVSGAFGALNVAVGQFAEYAAEGDVGMKNFLKSAAGLGLATGAFMIINKVMGDMAKAKEEARRQTKAFADALKDEAEGADDAVNALIAKELIDKKLTKGLDGLGVSAMDVARVIKGESVPAFDKLTKGLSDNSLMTHDVSVEARGLSADQAKLILSVRTLAERHADGADIEAERAKIEAALGVEIKKTTDATQASAMAVDVRSRLQDAANVVIGAAKRAEEDHAEALDKQREAMRDAADAAIDLEDAMQDKIDTARSAIDADFAERDATRDARDAYKEYTDVIKNRKSTVDERDEALAKATDGFLDQALAVSEAARKQEELAGGTQTAHEKAQLQIGSLDKVIEKLAPDSPLRAQLSGYVDELRKIPETIQTTIGAEIIQGAMDKVRGAIAQVREASAAPAPTVNVTVMLDGKVLSAALERYIVTKDRALR